LSVWEFTSTQRNIKVERAIVSVAVPGCGSNASPETVVVWPDIAEMLRRSALYIIKVLTGVKPADLPIEWPTRFDLAINLMTAKLPGRPSLLAFADEAI